MLKHTEEVVQRCSVKKVFLQISQTSQENRSGGRFRTQIDNTLFQLLNHEYSLYHTDFNKNTIILESKIPAI